MARSSTPLRRSGRVRGTCCYSDQALKARAASAFPAIPTITGGCILNKRNELPCKIERDKERRFTYYGLSCHSCRRIELCGERDCKRCGDLDIDQPCIGKTDCSICHSSTGILCRGCLRSGYGEELEEVRADKQWACPHCNLGKMITNKSRMGTPQTNSTYEEIRLARIQENKIKLASLGVQKTLSELKSLAPKTTHVRKFQKVDYSSNPLRRSSRVRGDCSYSWEELKAQCAFPLKPTIEEKERRFTYGFYCHTCRRMKLCEEEDCKRCGDLDLDQPCTGKTDCSICHSSRGILCRGCLRRRYGEELEEVRADKQWACPHCIEEKGIRPYWICNSPFCLRERNMEPDPEAWLTVRRMGYKSLAHLLMDELKQGGGCILSKRNELPCKIERETEPRFTYYGFSCHSCRRTELCGEQDCKRCGDLDIDQPCIGKTDCSICHSSRGILCRGCLRRRYGEELEAVRADKQWACPQCIEETNLGKMINNKSRMAEPQTNSTYEEIRLAQIQENKLIVLKKEEHGARSSCNMHSQEDGLQVSCTSAYGPA